MPEKPKLRIFISYGHDEYAGLADRMKNDSNRESHMRPGSTETELSRAKTSIGRLKKD